MTKEMKGWIENLTVTIREKYNLRSPLDFDSFIAELGGKYEEIDDWARRKIVIEKVKEDSFIIRLQAGKPEKKKRFFLARELGHLFIHMGYLLDDGKWKKIEIGGGFPRFGNSEEEREARYFAASFIMPPKEFRDSCVKNSEETGNGKRICNIQEIADDFQVSYHQALFRGKDLGILSDVP
jgi:Zn-dependent peptidase ImmA (M78 family)